MSKIEEYLKSLGNTSQEVADNLELQGIKGEIRNAQFCPVIKAIYKQFPNLCKGLQILTQTSGGYYMNWYGSKFYIKRSQSIVVTWRDSQTLDPSCPQAIKDFVKDFDNGKYPELIGLSQQEIKQQAIQKLTEEERLALWIR